MNEAVSFLTLADRKLAYQQLPAGGSGAQKPLIFLGGYASDMAGSKATFLAERCRAGGRGLICFDYSGHGQSSGEFTDGTVGGWCDDAVQVLDQLTNGPQVLVGSSFGGWIALLLARARPERVAGFIGISAAPDFTEELVVPSLTVAQKNQLEREGMIFDEAAPPDASRAEAHSAKADRRVPITRRFIEEAREHLVLRSPLALDAPVHLLAGQLDTEVPWPFALKIAEHITAPSVRVTLVKDGGHSLSREQDLELLWSVVEGMGL